MPAIKRESIRACMVKSIREWNQVQDLVHDLSNISQMLLERFFVEVLFNKLRWGDTKAMFKALAEVGWVIKAAIKGNIGNFRPCEEMSTCII